MNKVTFQTILFSVLFLAFAAPLKTLAQPENFPGLRDFEQAMALSKEDKLLEAESFLLKALEKEPGNPDYHFELANLYAAHYDRLNQSRKDDKAQTFLELSANELEQTIMIKPDFVAAHFNLGVIYKKQKNFEKAREKFRKVLEMEPRSAEAWTQIGMTYEDQGFFDEAKDSYLQAREMNYASPEIQSLLQDLELHRQDALEKSLANDRFNSALSSSMLKRKNLYTRVGEYEEEAVGSGGPLQAIPYIATMLIKEFRQRGESQSNWRENS